MKECFEVSHIKNSDKEPSFEDVKAGYITLVNTLIHNGDVSHMEKTVNALTEVSESHQRTLRYYHDLIWHLNQYKCLDNEREVRFTCTMDWKGGVSDFIWNLDIALSNLDTKIVLPAKDSYPSDASILYEGVLDDFARELAKESIVLDVLDDGSDGFPFILYFFKDEAKVHAAIRQIGLTCGDFEV